MKNIKFKAFMAIGIVALGVFSSSIYQNVQTVNMENEAREVAVCQVVAEKVSNRIENKLVKGDLNDSDGLRVANSIDITQAKLMQLNPKNVQCNIKEVRDGFLKKLNAIDSPVANVRSATPG
jgi:hypothetical protein